MARGRNYNIGVIIEGTDNASNVINGVRGALGGFSGFAVAGLAGVGAAAAAAIGTVGFLAVDTAAQLESGSRIVTRALGDNADAALDYRDAISTLFRQNIGGSFEEIANAVVLVEQNTRRLGDISQPTLEQMARDGLRIQEIYGADLRETFGAATTLMDQFGLSSQQAFDFIATGSARGLNASGDFLDTINEYSVQFSEAGAEADEFFSLLETGVGGGTFLGTDRVADLFKEFRVRILDGSKATAEGLQLLGFNSADLIRQLETGGTTVADVFEDVVNRIAGISDPTARMQAGFRLLGTQFEDLGDQATAGLSLSTTNLEDMAGAAERLNETSTSLTRTFRGFGRQFLLALEPGGRAILDLVEDNLPALENLVNRAAEAVSRLGEGFARLVVDFASGLGDGGLLAGISTALSGLGTDINFDLNASVQELNWRDFITGIDLGDKAITLEWSDYLTMLDWDNKVITLNWGGYLTQLDWDNKVITLDWGGYITQLDWGNANLLINWGDFIASLDWSVGGVVTAIEWGQFINVVNWSDWIYTIGWGDYVLTLDWSSWLITLNWGEYIIGIDWSNFVITLNWGDYAKTIEWGQWIKDLVWSTFIRAFNWATFIARLNWRTYVPGFSWSSFITRVNLASYIPRFPGWTSIVSALGFRAQGAPAAQSNRQGTPYFSGTTGLSYVHAGEVLVAPQRGTQILTADRVASIVRSNSGQSMNVTVNVSGAGNPDAVGRAVEQGVLRAARSLGRV